MRLAELDQLLVDCLTSDDHPEITEVQPSDRLAEQPTDQTRVNVHFASGATCHVLVKRVEGPNIPRHADYELPREAM